MRKCVYIVPGTCKVWFLEAAMFTGKEREDRDGDFSDI